MLPCTIADAPEKSAAEVARRAGVSVSTVSRVVNAHPSVSAKTVEAVRKALAEVGFQPRLRTSANRAGSAWPGDRKLAFVMLGATGASQAPSFQRLLYGVSQGADALGVELSFHYVSNVAEASAAVAQHRPSGLLMHGLVPEPANAPALVALPTVWLMANRTRPAWGDQVMPDNTAIGALAARYLIDRGHKRLAYLGIGGWSWSFGIRALAFTQTSADLGGQAHQLIATPLNSADYWGGDLPRAADELVDQLLAVPERPTGLFVAEDRLLPVVQSALLRRGVVDVKAGGNDDASSPEIISCNNDARYLPILGPVPPSIDIGAETIGRQGVEHLLWRIAHADRPARLRITITPTLVTASGGGGAA